MRLHSLLRDYGEDPLTYSLIHADLHPGNVFVVESRQQAAFIHRIVRSFKIGDLG